MSRMIDLDKLIQECSAMKGNGCSDDKCKHNTCDTNSVSQCIKKFAESIVEPEIDFDALYNEWCKNTMDWSKLRSPYDQARSLRDFLKSKNLTQPQVDMDALRNEIYASIQKPSEIPVKKTWTLKKEYEKYSRIIGHTPTTLIVDPTVAPDPEFYDYKEEPDYSKIPKGSIVEIEFVSGNGNNCGYVNGITNKSISIGFHMLYNSGNSTTINFDQIESIVILKLAKE